MTLSPWSLHQYFFVFTVVVDVISSPVNKTKPAKETEIVEKLQEHLRPNPEDATQLVFTSANLNGLTSFHQEYFSDMPLSTLRNIVERFKERHNVIALKGIFRDHCLCPVCADLRAQIQLHEEALKQQGSSNVLLFFFFLFSFFFFIFFIFFSNNINNNRIATT